MRYLHAIVCFVLISLVIVVAAEGQEPGVHLSEHSSREAMKWSQTYPGIAVNVILGTESKITPQQIEEVLDQEFAEAGVTNVAYFYRRNDAPSTGVVYYYSGASDGPFILNEARDAARKSAAQYLFQQSHPALRYEYPN